MRMQTAITAALFGWLLIAAPGRADQWVSKMLQEKEHDFGTVARGADTVYRFPVKNIYKEDVELLSVRSSCGCTSPSIENKLLETGEVGYVVASFNTRTFKGVHGATLTLTAEWNDRGRRRRGEAQVRVHGNIRSDVVFKPGAVEFRNVDQGAPTEHQVQVTYAGRSDWKITDVRGASDHLEVELVENQRSAGRVAYELLVRLKESAPAGYLNEQLVLVTNDSHNPRIPLHVEGRIVPEISVAPETLMFGEVPYGQQVPKRVLIRGKQPFKITSLSCGDDCFEFKADQATSDRHIVEIVFAAHREPGKVQETIEIATDLGDRYRATLTAYATVVPSDDAGETDSATTGDQSAAHSSDTAQHVVAQ